MSVGQISISSSARSNLLALQNTASLLNTTQAHLSSGKKVNSALDNATSYFASQGFLNSANDLSNLSDSMSTAVQTVAAATSAISSITSVITQMQGILNSAAQTQDTAARSGYASQFNALRTQIDNLVTDSVFNGTNLLSSTTATLAVNFNATSTTSLTITAVNATSAGLGITTAGNALAASADITSAQSLLTAALTTLRTDSASFGNNNTVLTTRQSFTTTMISTLQTASDNLVLADTNAEGANLQALQAQSQLGIVALGISGTQAQLVLKLF